MPHIATITELVAVFGLRKTQGRLSPRTLKMSMPAALILSAPLLVGAGPPSERGAPAASPTKLTFERAIVPIVQKHCWKCHGEGARRAGLDLRTLAGILKGGESGEATRHRPSILIRPKPSILPRRVRITRKARDFMRRSVLLSSANPRGSTG